MQHYVAETLRSVLQSDYAPLEIICVDDGSTDGTPEVLRSFAASDERVRVITQPNAGVCRARNAAASVARGKYLLPVDADNLLAPEFIGQAVAAAEADANVRVVAPTADFFGARTGLWRLPEFSLHLLARKNIMDTCALYRRADWQRVGGYCETIIAREDWEFWIALLKDGGRVVRLPAVGLHYRVREGSKRVADRRLKRHVVDTLNSRHPEFFRRELGGPLRYARTWSRFINALEGLAFPRRARLSSRYAERVALRPALSAFLAALPERFSQPDAESVVYKGRNELRTYPTAAGEVIVKSFAVPHLLNRIIYGLFRRSKAERSCLYAELLRSAGVGSPAPVGWCERRHGLLFTESYYASLRSELPWSYITLMRGEVTEAEADILLEAVGRTAARMHKLGIIHRDFSRGNILLGFNAEGEAEVEIIDLNRIRFRSVTLEQGCANFERLPATPAMTRAMARGYAAERGADTRECYRLMRAARRLQSGFSEEINEED